jgi:hypothetical protein
MTTAGRKIPSSVAALMNSWVTQAGASRWKTFVATTVGMKLIAHTTG